MRILLSFLFSLLVAATAYADDFVLESSAFKDKAKIPILYSCDGKNISPELNWKNPPVNTQSFALILTYMDSPIGLFYNWVIFNIPPDKNKLAEGANQDLPEGVMVGNNSFDEASYSGPCPLDALNHHYVFTLYALDEPLGLAEGAPIPSVLKAIKKHTLKQVELTGQFSH